ncbi:MAG: SPOR domain-containing protein, partial [Phaeodactylibacter sp.]|nr:SPOR domain-containing protein [Phaeodactylibacter sp.]
MQLDIASCISDLLYEYESVIIPGFGAFVSSNKPAVIDHVQGKLSPPSKKLSFNKNILVNDGILLHHVQEKYGLNQEEAQGAIDAFTEQIRTQLDNREMVDFPKVGRLYKDFENSYKFLQASTNFNTASYGLPEIQFFPVIKREERTSVSPKPAIDIPKAATAKAAPRKQKPDKKAQNMGAWLQTSMPWVILLSIVIIALSIYFIQKDFGLTTLDPNDRTIPVNRINTRPAADEVEDPEEDEIDYAEDAVPTPSVTPAQPETAPEEEMDTEEPTLPPNTKEAIVIIGAFGDEKNAEKLIQDIYKAGYDAYSDKNKGNTRVGVQFAYTSDKQFNERLADVRKRF